MNQRPYYLHLLQNTHHACVKAHAVNGAPTVSQQYFSSYIPPEAYKHFGMYHPEVGTAVAQWLRFCATNRKVAGSIPDGVTGFFRCYNSSDRTMALGRLSLWQKWVPGVFPGGKGGRCIRLTTLPPFCAIVKKSGNLNFLEPYGPFQACNGTALPLPFLPSRGTVRTMHVNLKTVFLCAGNISFD
jgi:hypothetical protein